MKNNEYIMLECKAMKLYDMVFSGILKGDRLDKTRKELETTLNRLEMMKK